LPLLLGKAIFSSFSRRAIMAKINLGNQIAGASNVQFQPGNNKVVCRFQNTSAYPMSVDKLYGSWAKPATVYTALFSAMPGTGGTGGTEIS
jgi:hypothetical protein